jgi:hypothetical protein
MELCHLQMHMPFLCLIHHHKIVKNVVYILTDAI